MTNNLVHFGNQLRDARLGRNLTQAQVATDCGLTRAQLIEFEKGTRPPSLEKIAALARVLSLDFDDLRKSAETEESNDLVALLRLTTGESGATEQTIEREITRYYSICREASEIRALLELPRQQTPPEYTAQQLSTIADAVAQGASCAHQERDRLGLGSNPIPDMADFITTQGIWASGANLPEEISGLFLQEDRIGLVIIVNFQHSRTRKRFSYAHEYAHAVFDRTRRLTVSNAENRSDLYEVRANAFASAFLMPDTGVKQFLHSRGKGHRSKEEVILFDGWQSDERLIDLNDAAPISTTTRAAPGSQSIAYQDVAQLALHFNVSYEAAVYRLRTLNLINVKEMKDLLEKLPVARQFQQLVGFAETFDPEASDSRRGDRELVSQVVDLSIEAFRRKIIDRNRLLEIGDLLEIEGMTLLSFAEQTLT